MPFGSKVSAARAGKVTEVRDQYRDDEAVGGHENGVYVVHTDGTMAAYLHMSEDGVLVEVGDEVAAGDVLGLVSTSGTSPSLARPEALQQEAAHSARSECTQ